MSSRQWVPRLGLAAALAGLGCGWGAGAAQAAGFGLYEQGARALGMAGAFTAGTDDPTAIFFNPAGLARVRGNGLVLSPNFIYLKTEFAGVNPYPGYGTHEATKTKVFPPFAAYYARSFGSATAAGVGIYSPYGLETAWDSEDSFSGRFVSARAKISPFYFSPTLAHEISPKVRLGAGVNLVWSKLLLRRHLPAYDPFVNSTVDIGTVQLESDYNFGAGFNLGVQVWPAERWRLGLAYRSRVAIDYTGSADFTRTPTGSAEFDAVVAAGFPPDQGVRTSLTFPAQGSLGVGCQATPRLYLETNLNLTWWNEFGELRIDFDETPSRNSVVPQNWENALNWRSGLEFHRTPESNWTWRGGYYFDKSPQPSEGVGPLLPDVDRHGLSGGVGWLHGNTMVDGYLLVLLTSDRSTEGVNRDNFNGTYSTATVIGGLSLGLRF